MNDSSIARVVGVLFSPTRTFELIREKPKWLVALLILVLLGTAAGYMLGQKLDWENVAQEQLNQSSRQLSEEQREKAIEMTEMLGPKMVIAGPLVAGPAVYLLMGLIFWVLLKLLGGDFSFKTSFATTLHGLMPNGISALLTLPVVMSRSELDYEAVQSGSVLASNLGAFAPEDTGGAVLALLSSVDIFSIWSLALLSIGFAVTAKVSRGKAAAAVIGLWVVYVLFKVGAAAIQG